MKNKQFEHWYISNLHKNVENGYSPSLDEFYKLPFSMQWGVYLEFFDFKKIEIFILGNLQYRIFNDNVDSEESSDWEINSKEFYTRQKAQKAARKKAFEILEQ